MQEPIRNVFLATLAIFVMRGCAFPDVFYANEDASAGDAARSTADGAFVDVQSRSDADTKDGASDAASLDAGAGDAGFRLVLGAAGPFAVLGGTTVTNTGASSIVGDLGVAPGTAITGIVAAMVSGSIHAGDSVALQAQQNLTTAYNDVRREACTTNLTGSDLGGRTLLPGIYCFPASAANLTGVLVLDAQGNANAVFIFQVAQAFATTALAQVHLVDGANACNVTWQVGTSVTLGAATTFVGTILAATSITLSAGVLVSGRALARSGAVTMDSTDVSAATCVN